MKSLIRRDNAHTSAKRARIQRCRPSAGATALHSGTFPLLGGARFVQALVIGWRESMSRHTLRLLPVVIDNLPAIIWSSCSWAPRKKPPGKSRCFKRAARRSDVPMSSG